MGKNLFDTNCLMELVKLNKKDITGYSTIFNLIEFPTAVDFFSNLQILYPAPQDYQSALELSMSLFRIGKPIPLADVVIAAISYNNKMTLITKDQHFKIVNEIWKDFQLLEKI